jgi:hypothetical protein
MYVAPNKAVTTDSSSLLFNVIPIRSHLVSANELKVTVNTSVRAKMLPRFKLSKQSVNQAGEPFPQIANDGSPQSAEQATAVDATVSVVDGRHP